MQHCIREGGLCMEVPEGAAVCAPPRCWVHVLCKETDTLVLDSSSAKNSCEEGPQEFLLWALEEADAHFGQLELPRPNYQLFRAMLADMEERIRSFDQLIGNQKERVLHAKFALYAQRCASQLPWAINMFEGVDKNEMQQLTTMLMSTAINMIQDW